MLKIKNILKNKIVANAGWLIAGKVVQMLLSLVVGVLTARYLGPSNYGVINYAATFSAFFLAFCTLGINSVIVKEFIDNPKEEGKTIGTTLFLRGISSVLSFLTIIVIVFLINGNEKITLIVCILYNISLIFGILDTFYYWFQAKLKAKVTAIATLCGYVISSAYKIVLLATGQSVELFAIATMFDYITVYAIEIVVYKKLGGQKLKVSLSYGKELFKKSYHFILPSLMVAIYGYTDKFMLKNIISDTEVGYYSTAVHICTLWTFVLAAIVDSVVPSIMQANKKDKALFERRCRFLYSTVFYVAVIASTAICILAELGIKILFGEAYLPAATPLRIVTWYTAFSYLGAARDSWIVCENKQKYIKYVYLCSCLVNVALNFVLIPYMQSSGAALASLITQFASVLLVPFIIKPLRRNAVLMTEGITFRKIKGDTPLFDKNGYSEETEENIE